MNIDNALKRYAHNFITNAFHAPLHYSDCGHHLTLPVWQTLLHNKLSKYVSKY